MKPRLITFLLLSVVLICCSRNEKPAYKSEDANVIHQCEKKLTDIIVKDIFTPPVASRVYVYPSIAAYEAGRFADAGASSLAAKLHGFEPMPVPEQGVAYDFTIAAVKAFYTTAVKVIFSKKEMSDFGESLLARLKERVSEEVYNRSIEFGQKVSDAVGKRITSDNYKETRGMERFEVRALPGLWVPTRPDYADAVEPHWPKMKTMVMDSSSQCNVEWPVPYSEDKASAYWKELMEVYDFVNSINHSDPERDERTEILVFWDDNPFVSRHKGHLMFQDKKMTPGGHWMAITRIMARRQGFDFVRTVSAYALTSISLYEAFISCWDMKYRTVRVRPETVIFEKVDKKWLPNLVTPPFPAYTSGHSTVSAAAAEALTGIFGDNIAYTDSTEQEFGLPIRSFKSFREAALEASISRVYAGIHYRSDCEKGNEEGKKVGQLVLSKLVSKPD